MNRKFLLIGAAAVISIGLLAWLFIMSTKPLPGLETKQDGRTHVPEGSALTYNFNPPTGGDHYASWITKGFYDEPRHDGNLVHSLEHGYIIFWYDCERKLTSHFQLAGEVIAHEEEATSAPQTTPTMDGGSEGTVHTKLSDMPKAFSDGSCDNLKNQIKTYIGKDNHKLIGMPRVGLTAWGRTLKLDNFDEGKIKEFIGAFRDNGPEHTNEP
jgi:hypothetical protein